MEYAASEEVVYGKKEVDKEKVLANLKRAKASRERRIKEVRLDLKNYELIKEAMDNISYLPVDYYKAYGFTVSAIKGLEGQMISFRKDAKMYKDKIAELEEELENA